MGCLFAASELNHSYQAALHDVSLCQIRKVYMFPKRRLFEALTGKRLDKLKVPASKRSQGGTNNACCSEIPRFLLSLLS